MKKFDPYAELEVPRDATPAEVEKGYKRRVKKAHPDAGGTEHEFVAVCRAVAVLRDPAKRKKFDDTGKIDEGRPEDQARAQALGMIDIFITGVINEFLVRGKDPRRRDLVAEFKDKINAEISNLHIALLESKKALVFIRDMKRRFASTDPYNPIGRGFEACIEKVEVDRKAMNDHIEWRRLALEIASTYRFERDVPAPGLYTASFFNMTNTT